MLFDKLSYLLIKNRENAEGMQWKDISETCGKFSKRKNVYSVFPFVNKYALN